MSGAGWPAVNLVSRPRRWSPHAPPHGRGLKAQERTDRAEEWQEDAWADVVVGDGDVEDEEDDEDELSAATAPIRAEE